MRQRRRALSRIPRRQHPRLGQKALVHRRMVRVVSVVLLLLLLLEKRMCVAGVGGQRLRHLLPQLLLLAVGHWARRVAVLQGNRVSWLLLLLLVLGREGWVREGDAGVLKGG